MISAVLPTYAPADIAFERGEGVYLFDTDGRRYLDFASGIGVDALGHAHPKLVRALHKQAEKLWHCANLYQIPGQIRLAERLVAASFADTVFFCNSGAEAVECGLKMVRRYHHANDAPERYRVLAFEGAFHGRTLAALAAGGQEKHLDGFGPAMDGFDHVPFLNLNALRAAIKPTTAAILVEPVQGESGIRPIDADNLQRLRAIADEFGLLLFFDEVQCGMGRTGKLFAHEWAGITPDILATAKGLGGGFPVGACLANERAASGMTPGSHGSTFGGNPLAMAVANAVLDEILSEGFLAHVQRSGAALKQRLEKVVQRAPTVFTEVRGVGLMAGLKAVPPCRDLVDQLRREGLLTVAAGDDVVRFLPPLIIEDAHIEEAGDILDRVAANRIAMNHIAAEVT
ncbi:MAG: acetylornithine transaminase [Rhodospirillaceae bacterium]|nr:MAG: acetylornithine transaminase [Rhodospirillaceae bacterium]